MGGRDDETPSERRTRRRFMASDTDRADIGREHRRADTVDSQRSRARRSQQYAVPEPVGVPDSGEFEAANTYEITSPIDILEAPLEREDHEILNRSTRNETDPVTSADLLRVVRHLNKHLARFREDERSENTKRANQLLELLNRPPDEGIRKVNSRVDKLEGRTEKLEGRNKLTSWVLVAIFGTGSGSVVMLAQRLWDRAEAEGVMRNELRHLSDEVDRLRDHRYSPAAERPNWPQPPTKEAPP